MPDEKSENSGPGLRGSVLREAQDLGVDNTNFVKEALKLQYNWIGLGGAPAFALIAGSGFPLVLAAGLELIYISVVPQCPGRKSDWCPESRCGWSGIGN